MSIASFASPWSISGRSAADTYARRDRSGTDAASSDSDALPFTHSHGARDWHNNTQLHQRTHQQPPRTLHQTVTMQLPSSHHYSSHSTITPDGSLTVGSVVSSSTPSTSHAGSMLKQSTAMWVRQPSPSQPHSHVHSHGHSKQRIPSAQLSAPSVLGPSLDMSSTRASPCLPPTTPSSAASDAPSSSPSSSSSSDAYGSSLYKTELCRSWSESLQCRYGSKCRFAHGLNELRAVSRHRKYKTEQCVNFARDGVCPYGPRCRFVHNLSTLDQDSLPGLGPVSGLQHAILNDPQLSPFLQQQSQPVHQASTPSRNVSSALLRSSSPSISRSASSQQHNSPMAVVHLPSNVARRSLSSSTAAPTSSSHTAQPSTAHSAMSKHSPLLGTCSATLPAGRHRSESLASASSASVSPALSAHFLGSAALSPAPSTVCSPFSTSSVHAFSPVDRSTHSPLSAVLSTSPSTAAASRPSSAEDCDKSAARPAAARFSHMPLNRERNPRCQYGQVVQRQSHQQSVHIQPPPSPLTCALNEPSLSHLAEASSAASMLSVSRLMDDDDENDESDSGLPSRSLVSSQHALHEQQQKLHCRRRQHTTGSHGVECESPPMTALHALHSQLQVQSLAASDYNDRSVASKTDQYDDEKVSSREQHTSPPSVASHHLRAVSSWTDDTPSPSSATGAPYSTESSASPSRQGLIPAEKSPVSPTTAASVAFHPSWSDRSASFSAAESSTGHLLSSRSSSFATGSSPFLSNSPFSTSPFLPFTPSPLPSTPFELPRPALPPSSPALSNASTHSSASASSAAASTPWEHAPSALQHLSGSYGVAGGSGNRMHRVSMDLQLLDEAEEEVLSGGLGSVVDVGGMQRRWQQQSHNSSTIYHAVSDHNNREHSDALTSRDTPTADPADPPYDAVPFSVAGHLSSPWQSSTPSLHIIDDVSSALVSPLHRPYSSH